MQDLFFNGNGKDVKIVTVGISLICSDGIVIGADRKVTMSRGTRIKSLENKIFTLSFRDGKKFLVCIAGSIDHAKRVMFEIDPCNIDTLDCQRFRDMVESNISRLRWKLSQRNMEYDATLLFGMIDIGNRPTIGHIMPSGLVELKYEGYFTTGIAAPYAEIVLKDSYDKNLTIEDAKLIVGGLIDKIGKVDNDVEGMDVYCISSQTEAIVQLSWEERNAVTSEATFSLDLKKDLENVKSNVKYWTDFMNRMSKKRELEKRPQEQIKDQSKDANI